jgi:hypothetical protein
MTVNPKNVALELSLAKGERAVVWRQLWRARFKEFLQFDSAPARLATALVALSAALVCALMGRNRRGLEFLGTSHRASMVGWVRALVERILKSAATKGSVIGDHVNRGYTAYLQSVATGESHRHPRNLIGTRVMVV